MVTSLIGLVFDPSTTFIDTAIGVIGGGVFLLYGWTEASK